MSRVDLAGTNAIFQKKKRIFYMRVNFINFKKSKESFGVVLRPKLKKKAVISIGAVWLADLC